MATWYPKLPQSGTDIYFSNNEGYVIGFQGLPLQTVDVNASGVIYLDQSKARWNIGESGGDVSGPYPSSKVVGITNIPFDVNAPFPLNGQVIAFNETNSSLSWVDANSSLGPFATRPEVFAGVDTNRSVTPYSLAGLWEDGGNNTNGATVTLGDGGMFNLTTSTTTITAFAFTNDHAGRRAVVRFDTARVLTHNATSLIIPNGANITTVQGDVCEIQSLGSGNFRVNWYVRKTGIQIDNTGIFQAVGQLVKKSGNPAEDIINYQRSNGVALFKFRISAFDEQTMNYTDASSNNILAIGRAGTGRGGFCTRDSMTHDIYLISRSLDGDPQHRLISLDSSGNKAAWQGKVSTTWTSHFSVDRINFRIGINTEAPDRSLEVNDSSGNCARLTYNDTNGSANNYVDLLVGSTGDFLINPSGGDTNHAGNFKLATVGNGFYVKEGSNATSGIATLSAGAVTVNTTKVTAVSRIQLTPQTLGTIARPVGVGVTARTPGTSFTITSQDATDTSDVAWLIVEPA